MKLRTSRPSTAAFTSAADGKERRSGSRGGERPRWDRRGFSTLWLILTLPIFLTLFAFVFEMGHLWLARVELENGLESAALAAVQTWAESGSTDTAAPRQIAAAYAANNTVRGFPLVLGLNYDSAAGSDNPNQNLTCSATVYLPGGATAPEGNLIFGAIVRNDPNCPLTFNAGIRPGCGPGSVLIDATAEGPGNLAQDNAWGIAFRPDPDAPPGLTIQSVTIDLQAGGGSGVFDFTTGGPILSDDSPTSILPCQTDVFGFTDLANQVQFVPTGGTSPTLTINFYPDPNTGDLGFEPGDRIRFGARTVNVSNGSGQDDGDGIGRDGVRVTVVFAINGTPLPPVAGVFIDNTETSNDCSPTCPVHPSGIADLPCPPSSSANNNGQSYVEIGGSGGTDFAVRAQAVMEVPSPISRLFGFTMPAYRVTAFTIAAYSCAEGVPRLVRVDQCICPGP